MERSPALEQPTPTQYALFKAIRMLPLYPLDNQIGLLRLIMEYDRVRTEQIETLQTLAMSFIQSNPAPVYFGRESK